MGGRGRPAYPAAYGSVIAVTAVDANCRIYRMANKGAYVDFAMPCVEAWTASPGGGRYQSGTSLASPFIAALAGPSTLGARRNEASPIVRRICLVGVSLPDGIDTPRGRWSRHVGWVQ